MTGPEPDEATPQDRFASKLAALVSMEVAAAHGDADRIGWVIERLAVALGFSVALAARGDPATIDALMTGAEAHAHAEAVQRGPFARIMHEVKAWAKREPRP